MSRNLGLSYRVLHAANGTTRLAKTEATAGKRTWIHAAFIVLRRALVAGVLGTLVGAVAGGLYGLLADVVFAALYGMVGNTFICTAWCAIAGALAGGLTGSFGRLFEGPPIA